MFASIQEQYFHFDFLVFSFLLWPFVRKFVHKRTKCKVKLFFYVCKSTNVKMDFIGAKKSKNKYKCNLKWNKFVCGWLREDEKATKIVFRSFFSIETILDWFFLLTIWRWRFSVSFSRSFGSCMHAWMRCCDHC